MNREQLIEGLVADTRALDDELEVNADALNRPHHLGHLAMAARMFMYLHLDDSKVKLRQVFRIESRAHALTLPSPAAASARAAWQSLAPKLVAHQDE